MVHKKNYNVCLSCLFIFFLCPNILLFSSPQKELPPSPGQRSEISLHGTWEFQHTTNSSPSAPTKKWDTTSVPGLMISAALGGSRYTWFRKGISIPREWENQRIFLYLGGARYEPHVFINNKFIAKQPDGWIPFELEITDVVTAGGSYTLSIRCQDWGATFIQGFTLQQNVSGTMDDLRYTPKGKILAPIGGLFTHYGIWDDILLVTKPRAYLHDIAINTSIRENRMTIDGKCNSKKTRFAVQGEILDKGEVVLTFTRVMSGTDGKWSLSSAFFGIRYWSPEDPYLYSLKIYLIKPEDGVTLDTFELAFGFRELWTEGPDFYLNGIKRHLLASSGWPAAYYQPDEEIRKSLVSMKEGNNIAFRLHTQPWQQKWLDIADEVGMLIIEEGALWCDGGGSYAYNDKRFWENTSVHLEGMVKRDRNHPCLVMWSMENEILHCGAMGYNADVEKNLARVGERIKRLDPTHLITYEADLDPGGAADVIGLHYPHEMPENTDYPNTADWLDESVVTGTGGGLMGSRGKEFSWDRKKPLYIGEYLWIPFNDFSPGSVFFGDDAYINLEEYKLKAKALSWEYQTLAYRRAGVSGMCPWTFAGTGGLFDVEDILYQTQKKIYEPIAAFPADVSTHFFEEETVVRTIDLFNDSDSVQSLRLRCSLGEQTKVYEKEFTLDPGDYKKVSVPVTLPRGGKTNEILFSIILYSGETEVHRTSQLFTIYKKQSLLTPPGFGLVVFDPGNIFVKKDTFGSLRINSLDALATLQPASHILIIAPDAFKQEADVETLPVIGNRREGMAYLREFINNGGRVVIMEQENLDGFMKGISLVPHPSTLTFPLDLTHPVFNNLNHEDFRFWQEDNYVTKMEIPRPVGFGTKALTVSGGLQSLDQSSLVEMSSGSGAVIFCQALAGIKYEKEPVARILLQNILDYLAAYKPAREKAVVVCQGDTGESFLNKLETIGLRYSQVCLPLRFEDIQRTPLIILHGNGDKIISSGPALEAYINTPGKNKTIYWHEPDQESFNRMKKVLGVPDLNITPGNGPLTLSGDNHPLFSGICREDLTYISESAESSWMREIVLDPDIIGSAVSLSTSLSQKRIFEIEDWVLSGTYVSVDKLKKAVVFATNGTASGILDVTSPGLYSLSVTAHGSPAKGIWPVAQISANGKSIAYLNIQSSTSKEYSTLAELPEGEVSLQVSFINDFYADGEDRNLIIDSLAIGNEPIDAKTFTFMTLPGGVVESSVGKDTRVIIDTIRWHTTKKNQLKGLRYASVLFKNMGGSFSEQGVEPEWVFHDVFTAQGNIAVSDHKGNRFALYSAGEISAEFNCLKKGDYDVFVRGSSTEIDGVYSKVIVTIDAIKMDEIEIASAVPDVFPVGTCSLDQGTHVVTLRYTNDQYKKDKDRNLFFQAVGFGLRND